MWVVSTPFVKNTENMTWKLSVTVFPLDQYQNIFFVFVQTSAFVSDVLHVFLARYEPERLKWSPYVAVLNSLTRSQEDYNSRISHTPAGSMIFEQCIQAH